MGKIKFYADATKVGMPFVCVNERGFQNAVFILDTGSTGNILFGYVYEQAKDQLKEEEGDYTVTGIDGQPQKVVRVIGNVPFCGKSYEISFLVRNDDDAGKLLSEEMGFPIVGIIGTLFIAEHDWVLDFGKQEVLIPDTDVSIEDIRKLSD